MTTGKRFSWPVFLDFFIPIFILVIITIVFRATDWDLKIAGHFFDPQVDSGFRTEAYPWYIFYKLGEFPAIISVIIAGIMLVFGFFYKALRCYRLRCIFVILLLIIGPGIIINSIFKEHWGRPRPRECIVFNGDMHFEYVGTPNFNNEGGNSFPSGHASMGFFMFFPFFLYRAYRKNKKAILWLFVGLIFGALMSYARIFQGGHFTSDCLWAGGFDYLTAAVLYYALKLRNEALNSVHEII
jgi:lipid A 4'-phosphatase